MKLDSPEAIAHAKERIVWMRKRKLHGLPYKAPKRRDYLRTANTPEDEAKALRKLAKLLKPAEGKVRYVKAHKELKRALLTKLKTVV